MSIAPPGAVCLPLRVGTSPPASRTGASRALDSGRRRDYTSPMFVAVVCDFASDDHRKAAHSLIIQYGFSKVVRDCFESTSLSEPSLNRLKKDLDRIADSYDSIRFYQYPVDGTLAITALKEKKWRRLVVKT
jgi:CRISPR-associated protein Cas2